MPLAAVAGLPRHGFPGLNALSYWVFLFAGIFLVQQLCARQGLDDGWFDYVPYASLAYKSCTEHQEYALGMILLGISTTVGSINFIVTLAHTRAPGMSINRMPILVWETLTASVGNLFAVPAVSLAFLDVVDGSSSRHALLRQHRRRATGTLGASVLDVWPPLGVCDRAARHGYRLGCAAGVPPPDAGRSNTWSQ